MRSHPEWLLFVGAAAFVGLHTVVDTLIVPQQGTRWNDHLAAALVPLALLSAAAASYPRLQPGARAALAAVLGVLSIEGGALAIADVSRGPGRAADWTGFFLWPAGLALCGLAMVELRRPSKRSGHRYLRRGSIAVASVLAAFSLVLPVGLALYATHRPRADVAAADLGAPYRTVTVRTSDGLDLAGWYVRSRNGAAVISFPTRVGKLDQTRMLVRHGYGVLVLDMRGYEGSDGSPNAFGWGATKDIDAGVAWLRRQLDVQAGRIGGIGFSVGGEQMLEAAADNPHLRAVVSEGAGERSVRETLMYGWRAALAVPMSTVKTAALAVLSGTAPPPSLEDVAARISPRSLLLIYAGRGAGGEDLNAAFYRAAAQPKAIWRIPEARHVGGLNARPREYERRVVGFFDEALLGRKAR